MAFAARNGQRVTVYAPTGERVFRGYVCGADDYHWGIVATDGEIRMVHKGGPYMLSLGLDGDLDREPPEVRELLEPVLAGYRDWVLRNVFSAAETPSTAAG